MVDLVARAAAAAPNRPAFAIRSADGFTDVSIGEFEARVDAVAAGLMASGVERGDRIALMSRTRLEWMLFDVAIMRAGAVTVPIYDTSSAEQVEWIVTDSGSVMVVVEDDDMRALAAPVVAASAQCREVVVIEDGAESALTARGTHVVRSTVDERAALVRADDVATIIYTSGTTGRPKGCVLTHRNLRANVMQSSAAVAPALRPGDSGMMFLPLAHVLTKAYGLFCLEHQMRLAFASDITHLADEFPLARPTIIAGVPRIFEKVYAGARQKAVDGGKGAIFERAADVAIAWSQQRVAGRVRPTTALLHLIFDRLVYGRIRAAFGGHLRFAFSGGGPLGERLTHFFAGVGLDVYEGYGLTETSPLLTINRPGSWKPGTVGQVVAGTELAIASDGEILARGPQVFSGYWNNDEATREAFVDGWFRTGDIGAVDEKGFVRITGRKKELIVTAAGKNVAPAPLEDRLRAAGLISQALVVGEGRQYVAALVTLDEEALAAWCAARGRSVDSITDDAELQAEIQSAVDAANRSVSRAESIRKFAILPVDFTVEAGELTPTLKVRRSIVERKYADVIEGLYAT
ncbi:MAG: AMP-dependent synthetase/ligase [Ilumatobacteraceae bacterium]